MKSVISVLAAFGITVLAAGTASAASQAYCDGYARDYANRYANPAANTLGGAGVGAAFGCIIGSIAGGGRGCGTGAAIGAGVGAVSGAANSSPRWQQLYNDAYYQCTGAPPAPAPAASYQSGSPEWSDYCARKYKSFNPDDGTYLGYDGYRHPCE